MGRKFTCRRAKLIRAPRVTVYPEYPVGSNEWHNEKRIAITKRKVAVEQAVLLQETKAKDTTENRQANTRKWTARTRRRQ